jgi:hypothetical protein
LPPRTVFKAVPRVRSGPSPLPFQCLLYPRKQTFKGAAARSASRQEHTLLVLLPFRRRSALGQNRASSGGEPQRARTVLPLWVRYPIPKCSIAANTPCTELPSLHQSAGSTFEFETILANCISRLQQHRRDSKLFICEWISLFPSKVLSAAAHANSSKMHMWRLNPSTRSHCATVTSHIFGWIGRIGGFLKLLDQSPFPMTE